MFFVRYLRASKFNMEKAEKMIRYYVDYIHSQKEKPENLLKTIFPGDFSESFKSYIGGHDNEGRPRKKLHTHSILSCSFFVAHSS